MKEKRLLSKENIFLFFILFIISLLIFAPWLKGHLATDTYNIFHIGYEDYAIGNSFNDGRMLMGILCLIANTLHVPITIFITCLLIVALGISCLLVVILKNAVEEYKPTENKVLLICLSIISYVTIFNFMYLENLYFAECAVMAFSLLCYFLAATQYVKKKGRFSVFLLLLLGLLSYQGTISFFFVCVLLFAMLSNNKPKQIVKQVVCSSLLVLFTIIIQLVLIMIVGNIFSIHQDRVSSITQIIKNGIYIIKNMDNVMIRTGNLLPSMLYIIGVMVVFFTTMAYVLKNKEKTKYKTLLIEQLFLVMTCILSSFFVSFMSTAGFGAGRIRFAIGATIGILFLHLYVKTDIFEKRTVFQYIAGALCVIYASIIIVNAEIIIIQHRMVNTLDEIVTKQIGQEIEQYELQTANKITKICVIPNTRQASRAYYKEISNKSVLTCSSIRTFWAIPGTIQMYTGRKLEKVEYDKEQMQNIIVQIDLQRGYELIGDTIYIFSYMN